MGHRYLNSANAGSEVSPYDTVAGAASSLEQILALNGGANEVVCASENIYVIDTHNESSIAPSATLTWASPSTAPRLPLKVLCVTNLTTPTTLSTGAIFNLSTNISTRVEGNFYFNGPVLKTSYAGSSCAFYLGYNSTGPYLQMFENCTLEAHPHASASFYMPHTTNSASDATDVRFINSTLITNSTNCPFKVQGQGRFFFDGMVYSPSSSVAVDALFYITNNSNSEIVFTNSDLSQVAWTYVFEDGGAQNGQPLVSFRNCKMPTGWSWFEGPPLGQGFRGRAINCDSGDTYTHHEEMDGYVGLWSIDTGVYATTNPAEMSAATGDTHSIKMVSTANVSRYLPLYSQWMCVWNDAAAYTPGIEVLVSGASAALNSDELWVEVDYNSGTDSPLGTRLTTLPGVLTAGSAVADGTTTWTGATGWDHKLSTAQITPDKPGYVWIRVALAKPSTTIYVNPARP